MFRRRRFRSPKIKRQRRARRIRFVILYGVLIFLLILLSVQISQLPDLRIQEIDIQGTQATSRTEVFSVVADIIQGRYFYLYPYNNILLYPRDAIEAHLLSTFPRLAQVTTEISGRNTIIVVVEEREAVGVVCHGESLERACFLLDATGFVFARAPVFSGSTFFTYSNSEPRIFETGSYFLKESVFIELQALREVLMELGLSSVELIVNIDDEDIYARDFRFILEEGTELIFTADADAFEIEVQNLQTVLTAPEFVEESGGDISTIEYIDLRFGNKVFYRLVNSEILDVGVE